VALTGCILHGSMARPCISSHAHVSDPSRDHSIGSVCTHASYRLHPKARRRQDFFLETNDPPGALVQELLAEQDE
jgi:hypothetical protein